MRKRIIFIGIFSLLIIGIIQIISKPIIGKWILGSARIIGKPIDKKVKINGIELKSAKIFIQKTDFNTSKKRNYLILYLPNKTPSEGRNIIVIDKENNWIRIPSSNKRDYELIGNYLFQSETGAETMNPIFDDMKGLGFESDLKINKNLIEFKLPNWSEYKINEVEIR